MTGNSLEYRDLIKNEKTRTTWNTSFANELGRLANGLKNRIKGTNTIKFIPKANVPSGKTVTYGRIVVDYRTQKSEQNRTRLTVGGIEFSTTESLKRQQQTWSQQIYFLTAPFQHQEQSTHALT